ncbi:MAG: arginase family protein [Deltaproteobacteria bacterium]|nr:arginase family protein [Candidatus Zymogenaceae bacterium]
MSGPYVTIDLKKVQDNARIIADLCAARSIQVTGVTKVTCGMPPVARAMLAGGVTSIGESRMENIRRLKVSGINAPMMLLRIPPLSAVDEIVTSVDISLNSEYSVIEALSEAAVRRGIVHDIILMVDLGDLREGIWPDDLIPMVSSVVKLAGVRIVGIGTNLSCYGGIIPTRGNMDALVYYADEIEGRFPVTLRYISGGNSSSLSLIAGGGMPPRINHVRIGEGILLGRETIERRPWPGTSQDAFVLKAEVIELKEKPSIPIGERGQDAFGGTLRFADGASEHLEGARREMVRAILNVGREDVLVEGMEPIDNRLGILGASSDHLIVDVTRGRDAVTLGGELDFLMNYGALLAVMTSSYVEKRPIMRAEDMRNMRGIALVGVPSWVGALGPGTDAAPRALRETGLPGKLASLGLAVEDRGDVPVNESIRGDDYDQNIREVAGIAAATADLVERAVSDDLVPLVLGGDHSEALGVLVGLSRVLSPFGLIWFDAHGDFIVPDDPGDTIISRMVLGAALGYGDERLRIPGGRVPLVSPENVVVVGLRDATQHESRLLTDSGVTIFTMEDIDALGIKEVIYRSLRAAGAATRGIHISFDIDVVDIQTAPGVSNPVMGGITYRETHLAMELLAQSGLVRSMDVAGINMEADPEGRTAHVAAEFILSAFGKKILGRS